jgi:hypothetical protein
LFEKIKSHPKVMTENITKMNKWVDFISRSIKMGIPKESIYRLIEEIIVFKINYYSDVTIANKNDINVIYPQCLHAFVTSNINRHFIFRKIYMIISYSIRYSGRNISSFLKQLKPDQYNNLMILENKLLELCTQPSDEPSQKISLSDVEIVETFNGTESPLSVNTNSVSSKKELIELNNSTDSIPPPPPSKITKSVPTESGKNKINGSDKKLKANN